MLFMAEEVKERLTALRKRMAEKRIDAYLIPTDDFHNSEYVGDYFKCRAYVSGFSGSAGTLLVTTDKAFLWTDGRYFLQAEEQLQGTGIELMKIGEPGVLPLMPFLFRTLQSGQTLGFDGRTLGARFADILAQNFQRRQVQIHWDLDLVGEIWSNRPALAAQPIWRLLDKYTGQSAKEKCNWLREEMRQKKTDIFLLSSLDDIAWLLNLRGNDVDCNPVFLAFLTITQEEIRLYVQGKEVTEEIMTYLEKLGVTLRPYDAVYEDLAQIPQGQCLWLDNSRVNYAIFKSIAQGVRIFNRPNPTILKKAVKNQIEQENERLAHIKDGVAVTKFMYWLKKNVGKKSITECSAARHLEQLRKAQEDYIEPSFTPIMAYGSHGAIVHYSATPETDVPLEPHGFLLSDTGGQYLQGTTDITRTFALGELTEQEKFHYTLILRSNLRLGAAKFLEGCRGVNLDILARQPLWELGLDFNHGTGHGVGYLLNVHEAPNAIRWKLSQDRNADPIYQPGMITSNEPGLYLTGKYGIRLENMILCCKGKKTEFGQFLEFETITMVPFDLDAVEPSLLDEKERRLLNEYHHKIRETLQPYLDKEEKVWLKQVTREI